MLTLQKPRFASDRTDEVFKVLRERIRELAVANREMVALQSARKLLLLASLFIGSYSLLLLSSKSFALMLVAYSVLGILSVLLVLNIAHEAVHGSLFRSRRLNYLCMHILDLVGVNSYIWKKRHVHFHHNYPNIPGWDVDVKQGLLVRIFPGSGFRSMHKYQHIYMPLLYPFYTLNWFFIRDYKDFFSNTSFIHQRIKIPYIEYFKLFAFKLFYIFYIFVLPVLFFHVAFTHALLGFFVLHVSASIVALVPLLATHVGAEAAFPAQDEKGKMRTNWYYHQLLTTNDFDTESKLYTALFGGFNHHVAHHMFPDLNHHLFSEATKMIKETAEEYQLPYRHYSLFFCLKSHYRLLKNNSFIEDVFEE